MTDQSYAKLKKGSDVFEIVIDADKAMAFRKGIGDIRDALMFPKIFTDAHKGLTAPENRIKAVFGTTDPNEVAKKIILEGEIPVTADYRNAQIHQKRQRVIELLHMNGVDPRTNAPHPVTRIDAALTEAKVKIDDHKPAEEQLQGILRQITPILPIKFVKKEIQLTIPAQYAGKTYTAVKQLSKILRESWNSDGSWTGLVEIPGGLEQDLYDKLNGMTHGTLQAQVKETKQ